MSLLLLAAGVVLVITTVRDRGPASAVAFAGDLREGGTIEALRLPRLRGGGSLDYASYEGRPLVINFFASWCPSCIAEMPAFERVHRALGDRVGFLGVSQNDAREASLRLAAETGISYDTAMDAEGRFFRAVGGLGMPVTVLVLPGGKIAKIWVGPLDEDSLRDLVLQHLGIAV